MRFILAFCFMVMASVACAAEKSPYRFEDAFVRATPAKVSAGYVIIGNPTAQNDALTAVNADWAKRIELHNIVTDDKGVMQMRRVDKIVLPAQSKAELRPGGYHIMIFGVKAPLKEGEQRTLDLEFASGQKASIPFDVRSISYTGKNTGHMSHKHH